MLLLRLNSELFLLEALEFAPLELIYPISLRLIVLILVVSSLLDASQLLGLFNLCRDYQFPKIYRFPFLFLHRRGREKKRTQTQKEIMSLSNHAKLD